MNKDFDDVYLFKILKMETIYKCSVVDALDTLENILNNNYDIHINDIGKVNKDIIRNMLRLNNETSNIH